MYIIVEGLTNIMFDALVVIVSFATVACCQVAEGSGLAVCACRCGSSRAEFYQ